MEDIKLYHIPKFKYINLENKKQKAKIVTKATYSSENIHKGNSKDAYNFNVLIDECERNKRENYSKKVKKKVENDSAYSSEQETEVYAVKNNSCTSKKEKSLKRAVLNTGKTKHNHITTSSKETVDKKIENLLNSLKEIKAVDCLNTIF